MAVSLDLLAGWGDLTLDEMAVKVAQLTPADRDEIFRAASDLTAERKWIPNIGPQTAAFFSRADIMLYGGQAGGGKTGLILGLAMTEHLQSLIMREQFNDLTGLTQAAIAINGSKRGFNGSNPPSLKTEDGRMLQFSGATKDQWQGQPFDLKCVGKGTPVAMGDGSWRAIEDVRAGDHVMTIEGPRKVIRTFPAMIKPGVLVRSRDASGRVVASQLQSRTHELLTAAGWVSHDSICAARQLSISEPMGFCSGREFARPFSGLCRADRISLEGLTRVLRPFAELALRSLRRLRSLGTFVLNGQSGGATCYGSCCGLSPIAALRLLSTRLLLEPLGYPLRTFSPPWSPGLGVESDESGGRSASGPRYCPTSYSSGSRLDGVHALRSSGLCCDVADGLIYLLPQDGAARPIPNNSGGGVPGKIPRRTSRTRTYAHPYTKGIRRADQGMDVCSFEFTPVGEGVFFDIEVDEVNSFITRGGFVNKNCFDEAAQMLQDVIEFHLGWIRSTEAGQRKRAVMASNPPIDERGQYLVGMFRPWLDPTHPKPAEDGELRWYATDPDDVDMEVDGPEPVLFPNTTKPVIPMSRTFIRARLADNPYLANTGYDKQLDNMKEPYRSAMRDGNFMGARKDKDHQVIPSAWIQEAMDRWVPYPPPGLQMTAVGMDVSQGGADPVVLAPRYGFWYSKLEIKTGRECPDGPHQAAFVEIHRRNGAPVVVDVGGGYGGDVVSVFKSNQTPHYKFNGASEGVGKDSAGSGKGFVNRRAQAWFKFRDALSPDQPGGSQICLPPDPELKSELSAPTELPDKRDIQIESKKDIRKRIGRSTDRADAVVMAWEPGEIAFKRAASQRGSNRPSDRANVGYSDIKAGYPR